MGDREARSRSPERQQQPSAGGGGGEECKLFVGNLSFDIQDGDLEDAFGRYGQVREVRVITDRETSRPRGFGFVTFGNVQDAESAMEGLQGADLQGRQIRIDKSTPKGQGSNQPRGGGYGGDRGGYGGDRGGDRRGGYGGDRGGGYGGDRGGYGGDRGGGHGGDRGGYGGDRGGYGGGDRGGYGGDRDRGYGGDRGGYGGGDRGGYGGDRGGYGGDRGGDDRRGGGGGGGPCYAFQREGSCKFGDSCRFTH